MAQGMFRAFVSLQKRLLPLRSPLLHSCRSISQEERLYQTDLYLKRNGRVTVEGFQDLNKASVITPDRALLLFRCCGSLLPDIVPAKRHELMLGLKSRFKPPLIDISHLNTLLLVQNENKIPYDPSEALAEIQNMGLEPNRVTYQHLIERYAVEGDIESANAILGHMKEAGMPVNEWIFGSLIMCHCLSGDMEGAKNVMEVMKQSGLEVGSEAHVTYILGTLKHRAKEITSEELSSLFEDAKIKEITFCDHDIFQVLVAASSLNRIDLAEEIISYLPRKAGYYQEMRNHIPGLIFNGHVDVAVSLFQDFVSSIQQDDTGLTKRVAGEFIPVAMVRSQGKYTTEEIEQTIDKLMSNDIGYIFAETLAACIDEEEMQLSKDLGEIMLKRRLLDRRHFIPYIRRKCNMVKDNNENILNAMSELLSKLLRAGIFPSTQSYSQDILPPIIASRTSMDGRTVQIVKDLINAVKDKCDRAPTFSDIGNACTQYHLNKESADSFKEALRMVSNIRTELILPISWKISLAKSYLISNNLDILSGFFFYCLRDQLRGGEVSDRSLIIWDSIPLIHSFVPRYIQNRDPDLVVKDVLSHLASLKITPPKSVSSSWKRTIEDDSVRQLIDDLEEPQTWTSKDDEDFNTRIYTDIFGKSVDFYPRETLSRGKEIHESLIKSIAEEKYLEGANQILNVLQTLDFGVAPREFHDLILGLCQSNNFDKALELFNTIMEQEGSRVFAATATHLLGHLISNGDDHVWKNFLLNSIQFDKLIMKSGVELPEYFSSLSLFLDEESKKTKLSEVKAILVEKGVVSSNFDFSGEGMEGRHSYNFHSKIVELIAQNKIEESYKMVRDAIDGGVILYGGTCIQMVGALSKSTVSSNLLKEFLCSISEDKVHSRQNWNGFLISMLNHVVDQMEDVSRGHAFLEEIYEAGVIPSKNSKAYYNTKAALLIKENKIDEALEVVLEAGEQDALVKNQEMMKIFAESEDLEKLQKVLDVGIGILGEVNALYNLIRCFLDLEKFPQVKKLLETPGFRYVPSNVENLVDYLIKSDNTNGLEQFVNYSRNLFACDRDYLYSKLLAATPKQNQGEKASEIWINLQEEGHIPSLELKSKIASALRSSGKYVPFAEEKDAVSLGEKRGSKPASNLNPFLKSLSDKRDDPNASFDLVFNLEETERKDLLSTKEGIGIFADILNKSDSESLIRYENLLSDDLNKLFFISKRKTRALIEERKVDIVDSLRENPEFIPSVKVMSEVADADSVRQLYDLKDNFSDVGKAIIITAALLKGELSLVKKYIDSSDKSDKSYLNMKRYLRGNVDIVSNMDDFIISLKNEGLISELGGPIYSYLLERNPNLGRSKDELSNIILDMAKNNVELRNMSTSALRICADHCEDEVMKRNVNAVISDRSKAS